jgi:deoxycytidylate deaminase
MLTEEAYFLVAADEAKKALCLRDRCGAIVVSCDGAVIGRGYNAPPKDNVVERKCSWELQMSPKPKSDRTCCMHAEWRAILDALSHDKQLENSVLYFTRIDDLGNPKSSGNPYCTVCSRLALDVGIGKFGFWHDGGIVLYDTKEYNELSYKFHKEN